MPNLTSPNAQTALVDLELTAVALCGEGANSRADILLAKQRKECSNMPKTYEELVKSLDAAAAELVNTHFASITKEHEAAVAKLNEQITALTTERDDALAKVKEQNAATGTDEELLKSVTPEVRALFEKQRKAMDALIQRDAEQLAQQRFEKCKALPVAENDLKDVLKTASPAVVDILEKAAAAIEAGSHTATGSDAGGEITKAGAHGAYTALEKAATKIQADNTGMTFEQAFTKACEQNPELYANYRKEVG